MKKYTVDPLSGELRPLSKVLLDLAAQENCDGEPYDQMQEAAEYIEEIENILEELKKSFAGKILLNEIMLRLRK